MYFLPIILIQNSKVWYQCNKLIVDLFLSSINPIINMGLVMYYQSSECNPLSQKKKKKRKKKVWMQSYKKKKSSECKM